MRAPSSTPPEALVLMHTTTSHPIHYCGCMQPHWPHAAAAPFSFFSSPKQCNVQQQELRATSTGVAVAALTARNCIIFWLTSFFNLVNCISNCIVISVYQLHSCICL